MSSFWLLFTSTVLVTEHSQTPSHRSRARSALTSGKTYICVTEAHSARLPLAQEQELVVSIDVRYAPILLIPAAHLAGIIRFCNKATNSFLGSTKSHLQPITSRCLTPRVPWLTVSCPASPRGRQDCASCPISVTLMTKPETQPDALCNVSGGQWDQALQADTPTLQESTGR